MSSHLTENRIQSSYQGQQALAPHFLSNFHHHPLRCSLLQPHQPTGAFVYVVIWWQHFSKLNDNHGSLRSSHPSVQAQVTKARQRERWKSPQNSCFRSTQKTLTNFCKRKMYLQPLLQVLILSLLLSIDDITSKLSIWFSVSQVWSGIGWIVWSCRVFCYTLLLRFRKTCTFFTYKF